MVPAGEASRRRYRQQVAQENAVDERRWWVTLVRLRSFVAKSAPQDDNRFGLVDGVEENATRSNATSVVRRDHSVAKTLGATTARARRARGLTT